MTITRPCRRMIRHLLQIFFTLGLTFTANSPQYPNQRCPAARLLVPVDDPAAAQGVRAQLDDHAVVGQDPDVVHPHLAADMSKNLVPVVELHPEEGIRQRFDYRALDLDGAVFLGHILRASLLACLFCLLVVLRSCTGLTAATDGPARLPIAPQHKLNSHGWLRIPARTLTRLCRKCR